MALPGKAFTPVFGSETGHEAFVPMCDYFEGLMSLIVCRVPDAGRTQTGRTRLLMAVFEKKWDCWLRAKSG